MLRALLAVLALTACAAPAGTHGFVTDEQPMIADCALGAAQTPASPRSIALVFEDDEQLIFVGPGEIVPFQCATRLDVATRPVIRFAACESEVADANTINVSVSAERLNGVWTGRVAITGPGCSGQTADGTPLYRLE